VSAETLVSQSTLVVETRGHVAWWTLNRPRELNALNADLFARLAAATEEAAADPEVRVVVIRGTGERAFSAGADLDELDGSSEQEAQAILARGGAVFSAIERLGKPVIAAVDGYALGGGLELALACTLTLVSTNASLGLPEVRLGLIPGYGGTQRLPRAIGLARALDLILTGRTIAAAEALEIGLLTRVADDALAAAIALAEEIAAFPQGTVRSDLRAAREGFGLALEDGLALEAGLGRERIRTAVDGAKRFQQRR
jgi:enoyl-CoA hydratase/carnithine racemase